MSYGDFKIMESITANSSRYWIYRHPTKLHRYLRRNHKLQDRITVGDLIFEDYPDEGMKLIKNFDLPDCEKLRLFLDWIILQPAVTCAGFGDQRMGKDASICYFFDLAIQRCKQLKRKPPRIVTLGNIKIPPFVDPKDRYFSFNGLPVGSAEQEVWIYCSEIETVLPARETISPENKLFSQLAGTFAQNHQKLFGMSKLASRVDVNFIRDCNVKFFKFISRDKLNVEGIERDGVLSGLGKWLLPKDVNDKSKVLLSFDNQLFTISHGLPKWYSTEYSEMFKEVDIESIWEYCDVQFANGMNINGIRQAVSQKFRHNLSIKELADHFGLGMTEQKVKV